jgi:hypothetical protein
MAEDNATQNKGGFTAREALFYHETIRPGKLEIVATKPISASPIRRAWLCRWKRLRAIPRWPRATPPRPTLWR